jgi:hypothetical protein
MRHFVMTRSAYGPAWDRAANARRLEVTRAVTARLMAAQSAPDWTWIVLLDVRDPFLAERQALYAASAPAFIPIAWRPPGDTDVVPMTPASIARSRQAAVNYAAPWREAIGPADDQVLTTRIDDDDGFAPDALARVQAAATGLTERTALMLPVGVHLWAGRYSVVRHERNAMHTLVSPPGDSWCVYDYGHTKVARWMPVVMVDEAPGWLWVRHRDTISMARNPRQWAGRSPAPITPALRELFPIDWRVV